MIGGVGRIDFAVTAEAAATAEAAVKDVAVVLGPLWPVLKIRMI